MPIRLFFMAVVMVLLAVFIGFNVDNRCDVSFAFYTLSNVPVVLTILSSFALGLLAALPFALRRRKDRVPKQKSAPRKIRGAKESGADAAPKDERFPDGTPGTP